MSTGFGASGFLLATGFRNSACSHTHTVIAHTNNHTPYQHRACRLALALAQQHPGTETTQSRPSLACLVQAAHHSSPGWRAPAAPQYRCVRACVVVQMFMCASFSLVSVVSDLGSMETAFAFIVCESLKPAAVLLAEVCRNQRQSSSSNSSWGLRDSAVCAAEPAPVPHNCV